jgi:hypothetical protein
MADEQSWIYEDDQVVAQSLGQTMWYMLTQSEGRSISKAVSPLHATCSGNWTVPRSGPARSSRERGNLLRYRCSSTAA